MNIGIDIDGTMFDNFIIECVSKEHKLNYTKKDVIRWDLTGIPDVIREEVFRRYKNPLYMCNKKYNKPVINLKSKLETWKKQGHKLIVISARDSKVRLDTKRMLNNYFEGFDKILFVNPSSTKKFKFLNEKLDIWIDDNPKECKSAVDLGIKTFLISNQKTHYNHNIRKYKNINVVSNISEINL